MQNRFWSTPAIFQLFALPPRAPSPLAPASEPAVLIRNPEPADGERMRRLADEFGRSRIRSVETYCWWAGEFRESCAVAEIAGQLVGFVIAYRPPARPHILALWQMVFRDEHDDIGASLVEFLLAGATGHDIHTVEAILDPAEQPIAEALFAVAVSDRLDTSTPPRALRDTTFDGPRAVRRVEVPVRRPNRCADRATTD